MDAFKGPMHTYLGGMFLIASGSSKKEQSIIEWTYLERADYQLRVQQLNEETVGQYCPLVTNFYFISGRSI